MLTRDNRNGTPAEPERHPELEELAALIDGRASAEAAARLRSHLASCAECREVFFETVDFVLAEEAQGRESTPLPFDRPRPVSARGIRARFALPAAAVLAVGVGLALYGQYQTAPSFALTQYASDMGRLPRAPIYHESHGRGGDSSQQQQPIKLLSFRLGLELVNFQVSLERENREEAEAALVKINVLNKDLRPHAAVTRFYRSLQGHLPERLRSEAKQAGRVAQSFRDAQGPANPLFLEFGMWTEAGKLAASVADESFLTSRDHRRFPSYLRRKLAQKGDTLAPEVQGALHAIETLLDHKPLGAAEYDQLARRYETILRAYD